MVSETAHRLGFRSRMRRLPAQLWQGRRRPSARLDAFPAASPACEIVHDGGRRMLHRREVDVARRLTPLAAIGDGSNRFSVAPHPLIPAFAEQPFRPAAAWSRLGSNSADGAAIILANARAFYGNPLHETRVSLDWFHAIKGSIFPELVGAVGGWWYCLSRSFSGTATANLI
jgi:hypothetical protein